MTKALLFDYGGTLDTGGHHWFQVLRQAWHEVGITPDDHLARNAYVFAERKLAEYGAVGENDTFKILLQKKLRLELQYLYEHGAYHPLQDHSVDECAKVLAAYLDKKVCKNLTLVRPMLERLKERYTMVLVSNFYGNLCAVLRGYAIDGCFDLVIESAAVGVRKPSPDIWKRALEKARLKPEEGIAIGDSMKNDILPAASLGMHTVWLNPSGKSPDETPPNVPTTVVTNYEEMERFFLE